MTIEKIWRHTRAFTQALTDIEKADQLEQILGSEVQLESAPLVLSFLLGQVSKAEGGMREKLANDLVILLRIPGWHELFEKQCLAGTLPDDCRYILASSGVHFGSRSQSGSAGSVYGTEPHSFSSTHQDHLKSLVDEALHQATSSLIDAGARIVILGDRGAGKSSICNAAFGQVVAHAGTGLSVTQGITLYEATDACPVHIYDTKGFETMCDNDDALAQLQQLVDERQQAVSKYAADDPVAVKERLHAIWWVIDVVGGGRFNPRSVERVASILSETGVPIIMVLNKCDVEEDYVREVERSVQEHCVWAQSVVRVVACPRLGPIAHICESCGSQDLSIRCKQKCYSCNSCDCKDVAFKSSYGFDELVSCTIECLPKMVSASFISAQKVWLAGLDKVALQQICIFGTAAGGLGATPLPFFTHFALFPLQTALVARLATVYGVIITWKTALHIVCSLGVVSTVGLLGRTAATAIKLVPGLNVVGCISDACVSASFTVSIGLVVRTLLRRVRGKAFSVSRAVKPEDIAELMSIEERRSLFTEYFNRLRAPVLEMMGSLDALDNATEALENAIQNVDWTDVDSWDSVPQQVVT